MTQRKGRDEAPGKTPTDPRDRRAARLAAALKENLKRRKAQARGRAGDAAAPAESEQGPGEAPDRRDR